MHTYKETHPWLTFEVDLRTAPFDLWLLLGESSSKCQHISNVPLKPAVATELNRLFLAKGALATTAIEGNTLSEQEVVQHLEGKLKLPPSREYLAREVDNIIEACNDIVSNIESSEFATLSVSMIKNFNRGVLTDLSLEEGVIPGEIRDYNVMVANYRGAPPEHCEDLLQKLCEWLNGTGFKTDKPDLELPFAILKAVVAHLYLAWIHPFGDGNGRTARLVELQILFSSGVPMTAAHLLSNHYNQTRAEYYRQLAAASKKGGSVLPFLHYAVQGFVDGLRQQLEIVREQQWQVAWENYVHEVLPDETSAGSQRRRRLVLDLSQQPQPVPKSELTRISARVAESYAKVSDITLSRDLNDLIQQKLIVQETTGWRAQRELILAFLPPSGLLKEIARTEEQEELPFP